MHAVDIQAMTVRKGEFTLSGLNVRVEQGYITGLIGPNGSGKTTLIRTMLNLIRPESGSVRIFGESYRDRAKEIKRRIGFVHGEDFFYNHLSILEMKKIVASFYPTWNEGLFRRYLDAFRLPGKRKIGALSQGMKMKFALAVALAHEPELLIMDEPTAGLDPVFRREILTILSDYIRDADRTVLFSTHISTDLERIADYMIYIRDGRLQFSGSKEELLDTYVLLQGPNDRLPPQTGGAFVGLHRHAHGFEGLMLRTDFERSGLSDRITASRPTFDDIMVYTNTREGLPQ